MIDFRDWVKKIESIKAERLMAICELCEEMGISYLTWLRMRDCDPNKPFQMRFATARKIRDFIEKNTPKV